MAKEDKNARLSCSDSYKIKMEGSLPTKPRKIQLGMFEGKYKMPPDELLYGDDLAYLFKDV